MDYSRPEIPIGLDLSGQALLAWQATAERHLAFSITRACPLRCEHCIVSTVAPAAARRFTVTGEQAAAWAAQLPDLAAAGVQRVTFTGGEPLLAPGVLEVLSRAAVGAGLEVTVVTAAHWGRDPRRVLDRFAHIRHWHLSTDVFHTAFIPATQVLATAAEAHRRGHDVVVRMAVDKPPTEQQHDLYEQIRTGLPAGVGVDVEPVLHEGRAADRPHAEYAPWRRSIPCISTGPVIHDDGAVSPCCGGLTDTPHQWPWPLPDARHTGLGDVHRAWREQRALRLIRTVGLAPMLAWARAAGVGVDEPPEHPCATCVALWREPRAVAAIRQRLADPAVVAKVDELYEAVFAVGDTVQTHETGGGMPR